MRNITAYSILFIFSFLLLTCQKEIQCYICNENNDGDTTAGNVKSKWQFDEGVHHYNGPVDTAFLNQQDAGQILLVEGRPSIGAEQLFISVRSSNGNIKPGSYSTKDAEVKFYYYNETDTLYGAVPYHGGNINVEVASIDSLNVKGIFSGSVMNNTGKTRSVVNGSFSSPLKTGSANPARGSLVLWAKELCNGPIKVKVHDSIGYIRQFAYSSPDCGDPNAANYELDTALISGRPIVEKILWRVMCLLLQIPVQNYWLNLHSDHLIQQLQQIKNAVELPGLQWLFVFKMQ